MLRFMSAVMVLSLGACLPVQAAVSVSGLWLTTEKDSVVEISPCGPSLCGRIVRILVTNPNGPPKDVNNPNPALRAQPIQGLAILTGFKDVGKNWQGTAYDPRAGKSYKSYLTLMRDGTLEVKGCIGPFCRTRSWTRAR